jgi:uncharacterized protein YkwD
MTCIMRRSHAFTCTLLSALAFAGCGTAADQRAAAPAPAAQAPATPAAVLTDGRTGDAVTDSSSGSLRQLSRGGRPDPSNRPSGARRDGIGAADSCPEVELMPAADNLERVEATTLCLLNAERTDRGLVALALNGRLARAALGHARDMVARTYFSHESLNGATFKDRIDATGYLPNAQRWVIGENLGWGTGSLATPRAIVNAWMNSAGHRANILKPEYREIGFGTVVGNPQRSDGSGATYGTEFGTVGDPGAATRVASARRTLAQRKSACAKQAKRARASRTAARKLRRACLARAARASRGA